VNIRRRPGDSIVERIPSESILRIVYKKLRPRNFSRASLLRARVSVSSPQFQVLTPTKTPPAPPNVLRCVPCKAIVQHETRQLLVPSLVRIGATLEIISFIGSNDLKRNACLSERVVICTTWLRSVRQTHAPHGISTRIAGCKQTHATCASTIMSAILANTEDPFFSANGRRCSESWRRTSTAGKGRWVEVHGKFRQGMLVTWRA
jgi:hypothetical protein